MRHGKKLTRCVLDFVRNQYGYRCVAHGYDEMQLGRENGKGKIVWLILKYRQRIKCISVDKEEPVKKCDE